MKRGDVQKAIFNPNDAIYENLEHEIASQNYDEDLERQVVCYTILGKNDFVDGEGYPLVLDDDGVEAENRDITFAKKISSGGRNWRFFIKMDNSGHLFNPIGIYEGGHARRIRGTKQFNFKEVGIRAFNFYVDFLRTKNEARLRNAEREALNG